MQCGGKRERVDHLRILHSLTLAATKLGTTRESSGNRLAFYRNDPYHKRAPDRPETPARPERLLQCMDGAKRMIYGGGFNATATPQTYRAAFDRAESFIAHLPATDRAAILGGNAAKLFGFK